MGMGIGAAMTGLRPIVEGMNMGFLLLAYNQISNNAGMLHYTSGGQFKVQSGQLVCCWTARERDLLLVKHSQTYNNAGMLHYTSGGHFKVRPLQLHLSSQDRQGTNMGFLLLAHYQ